MMKLKPFLPPQLSKPDYLILMGYMLLSAMIISYNPVFYLVLMSLWAASECVIVIFHYTLHLLAQYVVLARLEREAAKRRKKYGVV